MTSFEILLGIIFFIPAVFLAFFIPGRVLLGKNDLPTLQKIAISIVVGIVLWALQGVLFGYLNIRWFTYFYLLFFLGFYIKFGYFKFKKQDFRSKIDIVSLILIIVGIIGQTFPYFRMGWQSTQGIIVSSHNSADHIWHAALVKELIKRFPPNEPAISGVILKDYHYFYNVVAADLIRVFHLPFFTTQFICLYILAPILLGITGYNLAKLIYSSKLFIRLFLFFLYFSGNAAGWVMLYMRHSFTWNLASLINDASKFMDSPPYGYAIVIGFAGIFLVLRYKEKLPIKFVFICAIIFGTLLEFKIYVGIPFLIAFGAYSVLNLFRKRIRPFISFLGAGLLSYVLLKIGSSSSSGLIFLPVDIPRDFINQPLLQLKDWQFRWIIYQNHHSLIRLIQYGAMMSGLYLLIQFGVQLLGIFSFPFIFKKINLTSLLFFYGVIISAFILGLFFFQTVGGANIWEFFLAAAPFLSLLTSLTITLLLKNKPFILRFIILILVIGISIPQWIISMQNYFKEEYLSGFHGVFRSEYDAYQYISDKSSPSSVIFLANRENVSYASVANLFINRDLFLSGNGVRQIITPEIAKRRSEENTITFSHDSGKIKDILQKENISYVFYYEKPHDLQSLKNANLNIVFANSAATIFQVR